MTEVGSTVAVWHYAPVVCGYCGQAGVPTKNEDNNWRMPEHEGVRSIVRGGELIVPTCPGSRAAVDPPTHACASRGRGMAIEHVPEAKGLDPQENPMEGPSA